MAVIGKTAQDKGTKELAVGKVNSGKKINLTREDGTELTVKPDS